MLPLLKGIVGAAIGYAIGFGITAAAQLAMGNDVGGGAPVVFGSVVAILGWLFGVGMWRVWGREWIGRQPDLSAPEGGGRFFRFNTDHKVIGVQYIVTFVIVFLLAGALAMVLRWELLTPAADLGGDAYNQVMSLHGILMIAAAVAAILGGLGNYCVPLMIGARDMAFPRLNALSYWLVPPVAVLLLVAPFVGGWDSGWTAYPPLSVVNGGGQLLFAIGVIVFGLSSILGGLNALTTIARMRAPGMTWFRMPIFVWSVFAASILSLLFTQFFAASLVLLILDRVAGTSFFDAQQGGNPLLYQHMFWFYSHPAVYVMILPGFGIMLEVLAHFSRKPLFGYKMAVAGFLGITGMSGVVWAHHMFTSGMAAFMNVPFLVLTELISIPTGLVFLSALGTIWRGKLWLKTPMLFALAVVFNFAIGGITGIYLADTATDIPLHDTYFVVAHFHYTIVGGEIFALMAGLYFWYPKITGRMYNETLGRIHAVWMFLGFQLVFIPMFFAGTSGMNRRINEYTSGVEGYNVFASISAFVLGGVFLIFFGNLAWSWARGKAAGPNPWRASTLEWTTSSPPPLHNFEETPEVVGDPYPYGEPGAIHARTAPAPISGGGE